jgi:hypothetical protein
MGFRDKDQSDFDLETFVDLFDTAMTSSNPAVQKAFKNLLMIAAIVHPERDGLQSPQGPLRRVIDDIRNLNYRLNELENQQRTYIRPVIPPVVSPGINTPWPGTYPNTIPNWPAGSVICKSEEC